MTKAIDLSGATFNNWTVLARSGSRRTPAGAVHAIWKCRCVCGIERDVQGSNVVGGRSKSCGCLGRSTATHKRCPRCETMKEHRDFYPARSAVRGKKLNVYCRACSLALSAIAYQANPDRKLASQRHLTKLRQDVIAAYGGRCVCCGESSPVFLAIDHIHGGGTKEYQELGGGSKFYARLRKLGFPKADFQCLCHNCNWAKHVTKGNCPHIGAASRKDFGALSGVMGFGA